jgi:DNA-binding Lrp family transcriptional regulator
VMRLIRPNSPSSETVMIRSFPDTAGRPTGPALRLRYVLPVARGPPGPGYPRGARSPARRTAAMSVHAYILIQTEVGRAAAVAEQIGNLQGVTMAEDVTGPYDVIVRAEAETVDELGKLVVARVQAVPGITRTLTCPVVHL